ncbi:hypothetical protein [Parashewanella tropica]|uniref:YobI family P-loop NTPase n=1 Tax=Parashewanella tropica TaxID=2547970 RepID=UPI001059D1CF|nr:hypothetical protein [Parashewanella tropica]
MPKFQSFVAVIKKGMITICWSILKRCENPATTNSSKLPDLCPTDDAKYVDSYIDMLNEALINRKQTIKEIAITSPYSGGKSSLINTYIRKTPFLKFTTISLASFKSLSQGVGVDAPDDGSVLLGADNGKKVNLETIEIRDNLSKIEKSIVQQLLYKTDSKKTPNSRFRRIFPQPVSDYFAFSISVSLVFWLAILGAILYLPTFTFTGMHESVLASPKLSNINLWFLSYFFSVPILIVKDLLKNLSGYSISKFNPSKGELAFEQQKKDSIFNIYLDEIIYFFASQKSDVVVFEDLDRFKNPDVFIKLKELNKLINDSEDVKQTVRFIYALRDDVFQGKDRTKFFDVIIPIIPIASKANSYPQLKELMENARLLGDVGDSFLRAVSVYVDDMRMLKNIVTEFGIYKNTLIKNLEHLNLTRLFAFIVYKNVYCDDFALLQSGGGNLITFFSDIANLKRDKEEDIEAKIASLKQRLLDSEHELTRSIEELNVIYIMKLAHKLGSGNGISYINGHTLNSFIQPDIFDDLLKNQNNISYVNVNGYNLTERYTFKTFLDEMSPSYFQRKQGALDKKAEEKLAISKQIEQLNDEHSLLNEISIKNFIKSCSRKDVFRNIADKQLLVLLLERGYIDQNYDEYLSHFHEGHMTINDMAFIRVVQSGEKIDPLRTIDNIDECLKYLSDEDYKKGTFFNYKLFDHILIRSPLPIFRFIENYLTDNSDYLQFVLNGLEHLENKEAWIVAISKIFNGYWQDLITDQSMTRNEKQMLLLHSINALPKKNINGYLKSSIDELQSFINENESIGRHLTIAEFDVNKVCRVFQFLRVKFQHLSNVENEADFLALVLKYMLFEVHEANLSVIAKQLFDLKGDDSRDFSCLKNIENEDFQQVFNNEIEKVAQRLTYKNLSISNEEDYIWLLNNKDVTIETQIKIIETGSFIINNIRVLKNRYDFSSHLLKAQKIEPNWNNTDYLYEHELISDELFKEYLNRNYKELCSLSENNLSDEVKEHYALMITDEPIDIEAFSAYSSLFGYQYKPEQIREIPIDKLSYLIENEKLLVCFESFETLLELSRELSINFLAKNFDSFVERSHSIERLPIDSNMFYKLLEPNLLTSVQRKILIESRSDLIEPNVIKDSLIKALGYQEVMNGTDISNFDIPELPIYAIENLISSAPDDDTKKVILIGQLQYLGGNEIIQLLEYSDIDFTQSLTASRLFKVENNKINILMANILKNLNLISSFKEHKGKNVAIEGREIMIYVKKNLNVEY